MNLKKLTLTDIGMIKWSSILFTLFVVSAWQGAAQWIMQTPWVLFLVGSILLGIKPIITIFKK